MLLAVPSIIFCAASVSNAFKSSFLISIISSICFLVTFPTFSVFGVPLPLSIPAAFLNSVEAGGDFVTKVNDLSPVSYTHLTLPTNREV